MAKSDPNTNRFFWAIGIKIFDCYGSTEMNIVSGNNITAINLETIGKACPEVKFKIEDKTQQLLVYTSY